MVLAGQVGQLPNSTSENVLTFDSSRKEKSVSPYGGQGRMKNDSKPLSVLNSMSLQRSRTNVLGNTHFWSLSSVVRIVARLWVG